MSMTERWYPSWSGDLTNDMIASVLVGAGLVKPDVDELSVAVRVIMSRLMEPGPPLLHHLPGPGQPWRHALDPMELADAFHVAEKGHQLTLSQRLQRHGTTFAIEVRRVSADIIVTDWLADVRDAIRELGNHQLVVHSPVGAVTGWSWPVRIAVFSPSRNLGGFEPALNHHWHGKLFHLTSAWRQAERFDLLLVEGDGDRALSAMEDSGVRARAVVVLGEPLSVLKSEFRFLETVCSLGTVAAAARVIPPVDRSSWLISLVEELSHALPFHRAVDSISDFYQLPPPWVLGHRMGFANLDIMRGAEALLESVERILAPTEGGEASDIPIVINDRLQNDFGLPAATSMRELAGILRGGMGSLVYNSESGAATTIGETALVMARAGRTALRRAVAVEAEAMTAPRGAVPDQGESILRVLRSRLCREREALSHDTVLQSLTDYAVEVSIGPPNEKWLGLPTPFIEPDVPPEDPRGWRLRVVAWDPHYLNEPREHDLWLGQTGPTDSVWFDFRTSGDIIPLGMRVIVLHGNRVLQTGVLRSSDDGLAWSIDAAPEPELTGFDPDRWFGASITLNNDVNGEPTATTVADDSLGVAALPPATFDEFTSVVAMQLRAIAANPNDFISLESNAMVDLLRSLAQSGANLLRALTRGTLIDPDRLEAASRIQVVSTKAQTFFPAEFLYSLPTPRDTAVLCPGARAALESAEGKCDETHDREHVCPTGFWSMSKVLERHAHVPKNTQLPGPFSLFARDESVRDTFHDPLRQVLYAACNVADEVDPTATSSLETRTAAVAASLTRVHDWNAWESKVAAEKPSLLVLMPHHFGADKLRIGDNADLSPSGIVEEIVMAGDAPENPMVLLMGCKTLLTKKAFNDFVQNFQWSGASIVIATYGTILGRHASPATAAFIEAMNEQLDQGPTRVGDLLLSLRRKLLAEGMPMVLGLTSHGDADLVLERRST